MRPAMPSEDQLCRLNLQHHLGQRLWITNHLQLGVEYNKKCPMKLFTKCFQIIKDYWRIEFWEIKKFQKHIHLYYLIFQIIPAEYFGCICLFITTHLLVINKLGPIAFFWDLLSLSLPDKHKHDLAQMSFWDSEIAK